MLFYFHFIAKCETLKKSFQDNGYDMPDSPTTVQKYVLAVAKERTAKLIEDVKLVMSAVNIIACILVTSFLWCYCHCFCCRNIQMISKV